ncbi:MAG: ABC transporter ATP-binding protein [Clostridiales bacterium]|nr:ABC transporter ATP-binding protein [Clostridiales bacterium]
MNKTYAFSSTQLSVGYAGKTLIKDINIRLEQGQILTLIGPNGAGKSTILKSITRHLEPISGTVYIDSAQIHTMSAHDLAKRLSVVLTERIRPEMMTCYDVVASGRYPYTGRFGMLSDHDHGIIRQSLARVHAQDIAPRDFLKISDGQRQRILLARAICQEPEVIVLDEPTSFLDIRHKIELLDILLDMSRQKGITVILSLHEIDLAAKISDVIMCVKGDRITCAGSPQEVFQKDTIASLYDLTQGSYNVLFGSVELKRPQGEAELFVLSGAGCGIPFYRALQKQQKPFYAGILFENDVDFAIADGLAAEVFYSPAFTPISDEVVEKAKAALLRCKVLLHSGVPILGMNQANEILLETAKAHNIQIVRELP